MARDRQPQEIKQNMLHRQRQEDLASLLPNGEIQNWIVHAVEIRQAAGGAAAVVLQPPCEVLIGSDPCSPNASKFIGTIPEGSPLYREFAKLDHGDFAMVSGQLIAVSEPEKGHPLSFYKSFAPGTYCSKREAAQNQELFVVQLESMFRLVQESSTAKAAQ